MTWIHRPMIIGIILLFGIGGASLHAAESGAAGQGAGTIPYSPLAVVGVVDVT